MNTEELTTLLARIQVLDNRQVDELTIQAWAPLMADVNYLDAVQAVNLHFQRSGEYLKPAHVVAGVRSIRNDAHERQIERYTGRAVPKPVNFDAMVQAAQEATHVAVQAGYARDSEYTKRAAFNAAERAQ